MTRPGFTLIYEEAQDRPVVFNVMGHNVALMTEHKLYRNDRARQEIPAVEVQLQVLDTRLDAGAVLNPSGEPGKQVPDIQSQHLLRAAEEHIRQYLAFPDEGKEYRFSRGQHGLIIEPMAPVPAAREYDWMALHHRRFEAGDNPLAGCHDIENQVRAAAQEAKTVFFPRLANLTNVSDGSEPAHEQRAGQVLAARTNWRQAGPAAPDNPWIAEYTGDPKEFELQHGRAGLVMGLRRFFMQHDLAIGVEDKGSLSISPAARNDIIVLTATPESQQRLSAMSRAGVLTTEPEIRPGPNLPPNRDKEV